MFAVWDSKHPRAMSATVTKILCKMMFAINKVREKFRSGKTKEEKAEIIQEARLERERDRKKKITMISA